MSNRAEPVVFHVVFVYRTTVLTRSPLAFTVPRDAYMDVFRDKINGPLQDRYQRRTQALWMPRQAIAESQDTYSLLQSKLNKHKNLERFCDELTGRSLLTKTAQEIHAMLKSQVNRGIVIAQAEVEIEDLRRTGSYVEAVRGHERNDMVSKLNEAFRSLLDATEKPPSQAIASRYYHDRQDSDLAFIDGRYGRLCQRVSGIPLETYHKCFAQFKAVAFDQSLRPPADIIKLTAGFLRKASRIAITEDSRTDETHTFFEELLAIPFTQAVDKSWTSADHIAVVDRIAEPRCLPALVVKEEKGELGSGGDPAVQGAFSYLEYWKSDCANMLEVCSCPSFIVSLAGPHVVIMGGVITSHVLVQHLTDYIWLGEDRELDDHRIIDIARIFHALQLAVTTLRSFYENFTPQPDDATARFFPLSKLFRDDDGAQTVRFRYAHHIKSESPHPSCATFLATTTTEDGSQRELFVKFVERYGADAHRLLASRGLAPKHFYYGDIWPDIAYNRLKMVVMEYVRGKTLSDIPAADRAIRETVCGAVKKAVSVLHAAGIVHGDVRGPNVTIRDGEGKEEERTMLVDFDWAGAIDSVRYPLHISKTAFPSNDISDLDLIRPEHDLLMLGRL